MQYTHAAFQTNVRYKTYIQIIHNESILIFLISVVDFLSLSLKNNNLIKSN